MQPAAAALFLLAKFFSPVVAMLALGCIACPPVKALAGRVREVNAVSWLVGVALVAYFVGVRR